MAEHRIYKLPLSALYPLYVQKITKKGRTVDELNQVLSWLLGINNDELAALSKSEITLKELFASNPKLNPARKQITGVICGVRVEEIQDPIMQEIRYMDKVVDDLAKGKVVKRLLGNSDY